MIGGVSSEELKAILNAASYLEYSSKFYTTDGAGNKVPANRADPVNHGGFIILNHPESALTLPEPEKNK
jgi:hypothetical protein